MDRLLGLLEVQPRDGADGDVNRAEAAIAELRKLHARVPCDCDYPDSNPDMQCGECGSHWPCETVEILAMFDPEGDPEVQMADTEHYRKVYADHPGTPCVVEGCRLSQQEHHRLAYGWLQELQRLRRGRNNDG